MYVAQFWNWPTPVISKLLAPCPDLSGVIIVHIHINEINIYQKQTKIDHLMIFFSLECVMAAPE